jgi:hypothetical protein
MSDKLKTIDAICDGQENDDQDFMLQYEDDVRAIQEDAYLAQIDKEIFDNLAMTA